MSKLNDSYYGLAYAIECGLESGFPVCCIAFWCGPWLNERLHDTNGRLQAWLKAHPKLAGQGYVPCPDCRKNGRAARVKIIKTKPSSTDKHLSRIWATQQNPKRRPAR